MKELGEISLRMVKILLENGSLEVLATNLSQTEFHTEEIKELYHMRWGIETAYETLKSRLQLENFTGTKPILLLQDIYSTIYLSNLAEDISKNLVPIHPDWHYTRTKGQLAGKYSNTYKRAYRAKKYEYKEKGISMPIYKQKAGIIVL